MGTYDASQYQRARRNYVCLVCFQGIKPGTIYLRWMTGLRSSHALCAGCSQLRDTDGQLVYDCAATRHVLNIETKAKEKEQ